MTNAVTETLSVIVERDVAFPPEKIWRALTQPHLIEAWLMKNDFKPIIAHRFQLRADWGAVDCEVVALEPNKTLAYTWAAYGLDSVVTWTLTPSGAGRACAWSSPVSGRISGRPTRAPKRAGGNSSTRWSGSSRGATEASRGTRRCNRQNRLAFSWNWGFESGVAEFVPLLFSLPATLQRQMWPRRVDNLHVAGRARLDSGGGGS